MKIDTKGIKVLQSLLFEYQESDIQSCKKKLNRQKENFLFICTVDFLELKSNFFKIFFWTKINPAAEGDFIDKRLNELQ